ncbi:11328_t:CDS:2 [Racocetra persica]|uniref:11328_t:CDS:1 n=1 Tax=Racocetra persica TaxID=160502 RepID=A0ACA9RT55_9GLOM|nr:11328_t:CDS:2 [Racocetra persica]
MENMNRVQDFVAYLRNPVKNITAYNLLKARVNEEGFLTNIIDGFIIGKSAKIIWKNFTAAEKSTFITSASQIRSRLSFC